MGLTCCSHGLKKTSKYESTHDWRIRIAFIFGPHVRPCSRIKILKYFVFSFKIGLMQAQLKAFGRECAWGTRLGVPLAT